MEEQGRPKPLMEVRFLLGTGDGRMSIMGMEMNIVSRETFSSKRTLQIFDILMG